MARLNQIIAIEKGIKSKTYSSLTELHKVTKVTDLFNGFNKSYSPRDEEGEKLPPESKRVQYTVQDILRQVETALTSLFEVTARKDWTNCVAKGTVVIDEKGIPNEIVKDAPVSYLLFLEKQVTDIRTFVANLPILDDVQEWSLDKHLGLYKTNPIETVRSKKVPKSMVVYPHTDTHPAQCQVYQEDILAGYWNNIKFSGAVPKTDRDKYVGRADKLLIAIKSAREAANGCLEVTPPEVGKNIFGYIFFDSKA